MSLCMQIASCDQVEDIGYSFCIYVMKANRAVAWGGAQVASCDCDVVEGCRLSVQFYILSHPKLALYWRYHELIFQRDRERWLWQVIKILIKHWPERKNWTLTLVVSSSDAVFHFAIEPRVFITGSESPNTRSGLPFRHLEGSLIGSRERWRDIVHIQNINQHLRAKSTGDQTHFSYKMLNFCWTPKL